MWRNHLLLFARPTDTAIGLSWRFPNEEETLSSITLHDRTETVLDALRSIIDSDISRVRSRQKGRHGCCP
jgi:hypothetical protein